MRFMMHSKAYAWLMRAPHGRHCRRNHLNECPCGRMQVSGTITFVRNENMSYPACTLDYAGKTCMKKCADNGGGWCVSPPCAQHGGHTSTIQNYTACSLDPVHPHDFKFSGRRLHQKNDLASPCDVLQVV